MKKMSKRILTALLAMMMTAALSGCGKATPESLLADMAKKTSDITSSQMNMKVDIKAGGEVLGTAIDMSINMDMDVQSTIDPEVAYITGDMSMEAFGQSQDVSIESYALKEGEEYVSYVRQKGTEDWERSKTDQAAMAGTDWTALKDVYESFELQKDTQKIGDQECYVLTGNLSGDLIKEIAGSAMSSMDSSGLFEGIDWSSAQIPMKLYIDKKTQYPAKMTMDLNSMIQAAMGTEMEGFTFDTCIMEISEISYNQIKEIEIPQEITAE